MTNTHQANEIFMQAKYTNITRERCTMRKIDDKPLLHSYLKKHDMLSLFTDIPCDEINLYKFAKREIVIATGEAIDQMYFFVDGKIKIYTDTIDDRRLTLRFQKAPAIVGELEYLHNEHAQHSVAASTECLAIGIRFDTIRQHLNDNPAFLRYLLEMISDKFSAKVHVSSMNLLYPVDVRFASYLLSISGEDEETLFDENREDITLSDISEMIGTSYRHLNRVVQRLCDEGIIRKEKRIVHINDRKKLLEIAKGNIYEQS